MKIFDCFMYMDEEVVLDLRLHVLDQYVDYFVIVESLFNHRGEKRKLKFNLNRYKKFKKKIILSLKLLKLIFLRFGISSTSEINIKSLFDALTRPLLM